MLGPMPVPLERPYCHVEKFPIERKHFHFSLGRIIEHSVWRKTGPTVLSVKKIWQISCMHEPHYCWLEIRWWRLISLRNKHWVSWRDHPTCLSFVNKRSHFLWFVRVFKALITQAIQTLGYAIDFGKWQTDGRTKRVASIAYWWAERKFKNFHSLQELLSELTNLWNYFSCLQKSLLPARCILSLLRSLPWKRVGQSRNCRSLG